jgi:hypothetical protein
MAKRVTIKILANGEIQAATHGIKGPKCAAYIRALEQLLEAQAVQSEYTREFYEAEDSAIQEQQLDEAQRRRQQQHLGEG